ncbi:MAG: hypothetical protein KDB00_04475 [Planctomycetales bacterium]|nr:hypothetical protein [Planctomycetales bacterium]
MSAAQTIKTLVLGVGSEHGDDAAGWRVTERIADLAIDSVACRKIATPIELIDWLGSADRIHVIDAAVELTGDVIRCSLNGESDRHRIFDHAATGTHDFGVARAFELATALGQSLNHVTLWLVAGYEFEKLEPISHRAQYSIQECVRQLADVIRQQKNYHGALRPV